MSLVAEEILDQPRAWARAVELGRSGFDLPAGERIAVLGCGSSWHAAKSIASLRESSGRGETDAFAASEAPLDREYDRIVVISRSGTTSEIRAALERVRPGTPTLALVGDPDSPVAAACDSVVDLGFANDLAVVQTRFVTTVLCLARAALDDPGLIDPVEQAERALASAHPVPPESFDRAVVLARDWRVGVADAAALALRETAVMWAESYPSMEYRHGPIATAGPGAVVWLLDEPPAGLVDEIAATGATPVLAELDPVAELIRIQRMAVAKAELGGLDPDQPANLQRSVVLDSPEADSPIPGGSP